MSSTKLNALSVSTCESVPSWSALFGAHTPCKNITKLFDTRAEMFVHHSDNPFLVQIPSSQTQLSLGALQITVVESLYTPEIVGSTGKVSTFRVPRLPSSIASRSNDSTSLSPTGSSKVSDMSAITLPSL